jgi:hypothetical protein
VCVELVLVDKPRVVTVVCLVLEQLHLHILVMLVCCRSSDISHHAGPRRFRSNTIRVYVHDLWHDCVIVSRENGSPKAVGDERENYELEAHCSRWVVFR